MPGRRRGRKPDQTGRSKGDPQYFNLAYPFLHHPAWRSLSGPAVKVWLETRSRFNGHNNGRVFLSYTEASGLLHISKSTVKRAFDELIEKGFLRLREPGNWYHRRAHDWILTDLPCGDALPTRDWQNWRPSDEPEKQNTVPKRPRYTRNGAARVPVNGSWRREGTGEASGPSADGAA